MLPPAPVTFSTTTVCPRLFVIRSATIRAIVSVGPPAENGTTTVTGRVGKFCANPVLQQSIATAKIRIKFITPPGCNLTCGNTELSAELAEQPRVHEPRYPF